MTKLIQFTLLCFIFMNAKAQWQKIENPSSASFRSIHACKDGSVWAGGSSNTILKSTDNGLSWQKISVGSGALDFRGIAGINKSAAVAVSAGLAEEGAAKIYVTSDGGVTWKLTFKTGEKGVFMDGLKFFDEKEGIVYGDPIDGKMFLMKTYDGGLTWKRMIEGVPILKEGEASFAASNSNIFVLGNSVWIATQDRIFRSTDRGLNWDVFKTYMPAGSTAGIFGMYFYSQENGILFGGDYVSDKSAYPNISFTQNGGESWHMTKSIEPFGLKESGWMLNRDELLVIGTTGSSVFNLSTGINSAWDKEPFHAISCNDQYCFAIGPKGNLGRVERK